MNLKRSLLSSLLVSLLAYSAMHAEIPYALDSLIKHEQPQEGFSYSSFVDSMKWKRESTEDIFLNDKDVQAVQQSFVQFCQNFEKLPKQNYSNPPEKFSIPPIVHLIWLGSLTPAKVSDAFDTWKKHHPDWEVRVWTDKELIDFPWTNSRIHLAFEQADTWAEKADILRIEILYQFGGIYSDADVVCLNSFQDLIVQDVGFFSCFELNYIGKHYGEPFFVGSAVMGAAKHSHVMKYSLEHLQSKQEAPTEGIIKRTGPGLISRACQAVLASKEEKILILPCGYLYPLPWKNRDVNSETVLDYVGSESLAIHLWDGSWCTFKKKK